MLTPSATALSCGLFNFRVSARAIRGFATGRDSRASRLEKSPHAAGVWSNGSCFSRAACHLISHWRHDPLDSDERNSPLSVPKPAAEGHSPQKPDGDPDFTKGAPVRRVPLHT